MKPNTTIRSEIEDYIRRNGMNLQDLSQAAGMNKGILSAVINRNPPKPIAVRQLDLITSGMALPEGELYELYVDECFITNPPNWRRLRPFIQRCAELEKYECIESILHRLAEDLSFIPGLFETAELLYNQGLNKAAVLLYKCVAEGERFQHSERLAICQFRLFSLSIGEDQQENLRAAVRFESYIDRLPEDIQLDALCEFMNVYFPLDNMDKVIEISEKLVFRADCQHAINKQNVKRTERRIKYPVVVYKAYAYLMRAGAYGRFKDYDKAYKYTLLYMNMDWSEEREKDVNTYIAKFQAWGESNTYFYRLRQGEWNVLPQCVSYMSENEEEVLQGLFTLTEVANSADVDVDWVFTQFKEQISSYIELNWLPDYYSKQFGMDYSLRFLIELAVYHLRRQRYETGFEWILHSLNKSIKVKSDTGFIKCVRIFEEFRHVASANAQIEYSRIVKEVKT
ncbi:hypothetical protein [Paenibacillus macquariensis]|uniref:HTH cro/C1-type domain-containing protein n=1 Tax=Paenibacillus macquariensis TaxID=948756 RepID=A0ABY1K5X1_9BACL|nr:hypothetical protein [Paenibacillus macquariensis]MEC0090544.1 transcriptional regulator [Paenibacillus macquariensis]OAB38542.1 hypothetical protein PMSM_01710 [Paenibacillus macquariensis subsp. macquariensis]SIR30877.1 hypothetical protein SAMN05421578_110164 [Paenibacillus macquariensis]